jgi:DNA polymerase-1
MKLNIRLVGFELPNFKTATLKECVDYLKNKPLIAVDTETTGLDPYLSNVVMLQIGDLNTQFIIDVRKLGVQSLRPILENPNTKKILVNAKFDYKMIKHHFKIELNNVVDCMLQEMMLENGRQFKGFGLADMTQKYVNSNYFSKQLNIFEPNLTKEVRTEFITIKDKPFTSEQVIYGAYDVILPILINEKQEIRLKEDQINPAINNEFVLALGDIELNGFYLDEEKWVELYEKNFVEFNEIKEEINEKVRKKIPTKYEKDINWNSPKQVIGLFKKLGIPVVKAKKIVTLAGTRWESNETVDSRFLSSFKDQSEIVGLYLKYKELQKSVSSYGSKFLKHIHPVTNRVHSQYRQFLSTGRMSSQKPNLQNIKRDSEFRSCFVAQHPGWKLVVCDYSSQESRIMAELGNEERLINIFENGDGDFHSYTARRVFKISVDNHPDPDQRYTGKVLNFSIPYGAGPYKIASLLAISEKAGDDLIKEWSKAYPDLLRYFQRAQKFARDNGYIILDPVTRKRFYPSVYDKYVVVKKEIERMQLKKLPVPKLYWSIFFSTKGSLERKAQNYPIQGTGASMTKYAVVLFRRWLKEKNYNDFIKIVNVIHDEIVIEYKEEFSEVAASQLRKCMEESGRLFVKSLTMIANPVNTKYWKH